MLHLSVKDFMIIAIVTPNLTIRKIKSVNDSPQGILMVFLKLYNINDFSQHTLESEISVGPTFINFGTFSQPYDPYSGPYAYQILVCNFDQIFVLYKP